MTNKLEISDYLNIWESADVDWTFNIVPKDQSRGHIQSLIETNDAGNYIKKFSYEVSENHESLFDFVLYDHGSELYYSHPDIKIYEKLRHNKRLIPKEEVISMLESMDIFKYKYSTIPEKALNKITEKIIRFDGKNFEPLKYYYALEANIHYAELGLIRSIYKL